MLRSSSLGFGHKSFGIIGALAILSLPTPAHAQFLWTGNGGTNLWSTPANWNTMVAPPSSQNTAILFAGALGLMPNQNIASPFLLNSLTFIPASGAFDLLGAPLDFRTNTSAVLPTMVQNSPTAMIIRNNLVLTNDLTYSGIGSADLMGTITGVGGFTKAGSGTLTLANTGNAYTGSTNVQEGTLRMGAVTALPATTALTVNTDTTLDLNGFDTTVGSLSGGGAVTTGGALLTVGGSAATSFFGSISGTGGLVKTGSGTLNLSGSNSYTGDTTVNGGILQLIVGENTSTNITVIAGLFRIDIGGTLTLPSYGSVTVQSGGSATYDSGTINGGFLRGPGTHELIGGMHLNGVTTLTSATINQIGAASVTNFSNGGAFTVSAGQTLTWNGGTNTSSGRLTVNGTANVNDFVSNGILTVPNGGLINNTGSNMVLGSGSTTFVGAVGNLGGKIDLGGQQLHVRGGLLVTNSGTFASGNGVRNGTTVADYGALVKGTGPYQSVITQNGGQYLPGNSPGTSQVGDFFINPGGNLIFQITDAGPSLTFPSAPGIAGSNPGWGLTQVFTSMNFTATPASPYTITMQTQLPPPAAPDTPGPMSSFDPNRAYQWLIFDLQPGAAFNGTFDPNAINFATAAFVNSTMGGTFSLARNGGQIFLTFTPVPEPVWILGVAFGALVIRRVLRRSPGQGFST